MVVAEKTSVPLMSMREVGDGGGGTCPNEFFETEISSMKKPIVIASRWTRIGRYNFLESPGRLSGKVEFTVSRG